MNINFIRYSIGKLLQLLSFSLSFPFLIAIFETHKEKFPYFLLDEKTFGFIIAIFLSFVTGFLFTLKAKNQNEEKTLREGIVVVAFAWIILSFFGALPFYVYFIKTNKVESLVGHWRAFTDAYFEVISGFTTTGATILSDIEILPKGLLFWRSMTHWLGGMGIVTLGIAIFPAFGGMSYQLFRGEIPGPTAERLKPSLAQTAKLLWGIYALLTLLETILLWLGKMPFFDAICHAFGTMATGGFSTKNASIAYYNSAYIQWVIIIFMFLAGMNFLLHYTLLFTGDWKSVKDNHEFRFYVLTLLISSFFIALILFIQGLDSQNNILRSYRFNPLSSEKLASKIIEEEGRLSGISNLIRHSFFQVVSITTTTGYCTADFDMWPSVVKFLLVALMFFGGCAGSTGGGIKMIRILVLLKAALREIQTMIQPRQVIALKFADKVIDEKQVQKIMGFFVIFILFTVIFSFIMSLIIPDVTTAFTSVVATLCNIGPGLSGVGATENYSWIPTTGKWVLSLCMLLGRLELYTVLIAFSPSSWKK